ncbi:unnamed protein product [Adineta steineri]|uniref:Uncharacterized protein n=1 Tax=Adineta steineri TaxID=433720 RepID=A0A813VXU7_9BILA|nr:unnamed protein product [Adineta steineri]CAF0845220.1 unnamed protein product [Adineta steineri]CAF4053949.1 unnamed protein product [Adineta steineri]CAF4134804.1 unnamed protein product [Adineta steineri]
MVVNQAAKPNIHIHDFTNKRLSDEPLAALGITCDNDGVNCCDDCLYRNNGALGRTRNGRLVRCSHIGSYVDDDGDCAIDPNYCVRLCFCPVCPIRSGGFRPNPDDPNCLDRCLEFTYETVPTTTTTTTTAAKTITLNRGADDEL